MFYECDLVSCVYITLFVICYGMLVDTIFYPPLICMPDPEKSQNIIFSSWGRKNIQNDAVQPIWALEHPKCIFQLK